MKSRLEFRCVQPLYHAIDRDDVPIRQLRRSLDTLLQVEHPGKGCLDCGRDAEQ